ncbi:PepSY domain-containing protein [Streptomyces paromomycinus]|uniref:Lipoprotein n=1 Tax=Streptomyces paromomycinus TaxID=92743 RepID=A0A401VYP9_STREY|nr:PepSY domain-containing protein [Streptomyces paromomycinus]GCD42182.1 lipoprotein [Streptomyces paromomycinus]
MTKRVRGAGVAACAVVVAGVLLAGCGDDGGGGGKENSASPSASAAAPSASASGGESSGGSGQMTEDQRSRKALVPEAKISYDKALKAATEAVADSKPVSVELKRGAGGKPEWHAKVAASDGTESTVRVDAVTGEADKPQTKSEDGDDKKELADRLGRASVTAQQAADTATGKKSGTVTAVELDTNDQKKEIWSVDVVTTNDWNKTTYDVDATDRKVLREHVDRD